jgi:hypothetical protein
MAPGPVSVDTSPYHLHTSSRNNRPGYHSLPVPKRWPGEGGRTGSDIPSRQDRESTEWPEEQRGLESSACLVLRFSHGAKTRHGVVAGCAPNVDLPLQKRPGVSRFHLAFTFDDKDRPIARDLGSLCGTRVIYDGEERERRSNFDYLLQGPGILGNKPPVLNVTGDVQFKVVVPPRDITSQDYIDRVARFRQGTADPEDLFASLVLRSAPGTQPPTGTHTAPRLSDGPALFEKKLSEGAFAVVTYVWNATTGEEYALKEPLEKFIKSGQVITMDWKREAEVMGGISHVSAAPSIPNILKIALYLQPTALGPYCRVSRCHILPLAPVDLRVCPRRLSRHLHQLVHLRKRTSPPPITFGPAIPPRTKPSDRTS